MLAVNSHQPQQDLHGVSSAPVVSTRVTWPFASERWTLYREICRTSNCCPFPQGGSDQLLVNIITVENLVAVIIPCRWHFPVAGSGKRLRPKSSDMSSCSGHCNVLRSICQMSWATRSWNNLFSLFPWIYYRSFLFVSLNFPRVPAWLHWFCALGCLENIDASSKCETFLISYIKDIFKWEFLSMCSFLPCPVFPGESYTN